MKNEITLQKIKLAFLRKLPEDCTELIDGQIQVRDNIHEDFIRNLLTAQLSGYLWGEPGPSRTIKYPADWWSAFKLRWFPAWLLTHHPAQYQCHEINLTTLYPLFRISLAKETSVLKFDVKDYKASSADAEAD